MSLRILHSNVFIFLKGRLSTELAPYSGQPESVFKNLNITIMWEFIQQNRRVTYEKTSA